MTEAPLPKEVLTLFQRYTDYAKDTNAVTKLSVQALSLTQDMLGILYTILPSVEGDKKTVIENKISGLEKNAEIAAREVKSGYSTIFSQALVANWAALETLMEDLTILWLVCGSAGLNNEVFQKVKFTLAIYEELTKEERMQYLLKEAMRFQGTDMKSGISRFETPLDWVGLGGSVDKQVKTDMYEFSQIRNLIVHRMCIVDKKFHEACPNISPGVGKTLYINMEQFSRYSGAAIDYAGIIAKRVIAATSPP